MTKPELSTLETTENNPKISGELLLLEIAARNLIVCSSFEWGLEWLDMVCQVKFQSNCRCVLTLIAATGNEHNEIAKIQRPLYIPTHQSPLIVANSLTIQRNRTNREYVFVDTDCRAVWRWMVLAGILMHTLHTDFDWIISCVSLRLVDAIGFDGFALCSGKSRFHSHLFIFFFSPPYVHSVPRWCYYDLHLMRTSTQFHIRTSHLNANVREPERWIESTAICAAVVHK